jgi:hypothetical protein
MHVRTKLLITTLGAAVVLAAAVGTATARRLEINNQFIRVVWNELKFVEGGGGGPVFTCPVTLEGSFHSRTISKVSGQLIGYITRAALTRANCVLAGGAENIRFLNGVEEPTNTLPWHVRYDSFEGTLPAITGVRLQIIGFGWLVTMVGVSCLYKSTEAAPFFGNAILNVGQVVTNLRLREERTIPKFAGGALCPNTVRYGSATASTVTLLGATTSIVIRLVQ